MNKKRVVNTEDKKWALLKWPFIYLIIDIAKWVELA